MAKEDSNLEGYEEITKELAAAEPVADTEESAVSEVSEETEAANESVLDFEEEILSEDESDNGSGDEAVSPIRRQVIVKKKKRKVNMTSLITIIVCACIVLACFIFMAIKLDWIGTWFPSKAKMTMGDYKVIEISDSYKTIDEETVQAYIDDALSEYDTEETITEGTVKEGDLVNIDYAGTYADGENAGEAFSGGTSEDYDVEAGSETLLFDTELIGLEIGSTTDIPVTFPDDYSEESLQGVNTIFAVTINYVTETIEQEYTDEWCKEYSEAHLPEVLNTTEEFTEYMTNYYYKQYLHNAMFEQLITLANVTSYDKAARDELINYYATEAEYYATYYYGIDADTYASYMGFSTAEEYEVYYAEYNLKRIMVVDRICDDLGIETSEEGLDAALEENMKSYGYDEYYTLDEYKEACGDAWLMVFEAIGYKLDLAMDALEDRVMFVESMEEAEETIEDYEEELAEEVEGDLDMDIDDDMEE